MSDVPCTHTVISAEERGGLRFRLENAANRTETDYTKLGNWVHYKVYFFYEIHIVTLFKH